MISYRYVGTSRPVQGIGHLPDAYRDFFIRFEERSEPDFRYGVVVYGVQLPTEVLRNYGLRLLVETDDEIDSMSSIIVAEIEYPDAYVEEYRDGETNYARMMLSRWTEYCYITADNMVELLYRVYIGCVTE